jgi:hypothetical protein
MEKFLFTDGTTTVKEVHSPQELQALVEAASRPDAIRIWIFSTNEWLSYAAFLRRRPSFASPKNHAVVKDVPALPKNPAGKKVFRRMLYTLAFGAGIFLVFNFTRINWKKDTPVQEAAARPANVPLMDVDSLITTIEYERGKSIDRNTRNNLRLRNTWPDRILLQWTAEKESSSAGSRFSAVKITIDNTTGYNLDEAVLKLLVWEKDKATVADTLRFSGIRYDKPGLRELAGMYRGDSISVAFESVRAKAFNFCYSDKLKNNSGNYNDRWFCRE